MNKIIFFQPYIANWREEFLIRFIDDTKDIFEVEVLTGYHDSKKIISSNRKSSKIVDKVLYSLNKNIKFKKQYYPIYFSPGLFFELVKRRPDVIVTEGEINIFNNILISLYSILFRKKYLWWSLGKVRNRKENILNLIFNLPMNFLIKHANFILARNSLAKEYYLNKGYNDEKIILVPNSMDDNKIKKYMSSKNTYNLETNNILFIGKLIKEKNVDLLIDVVNDLSKEIKDIQLIIVGEGVEKNKLQKLSAQLNFNQNIVFTGAIYEGVSEQFYNSNLVVLPGMGGLSIQHAMLHARPVICTVADGIEHDLVINNKTGMIVESNSKEELFKSIKKFLNNKESTKLMGENALRHVNENWNMNIMIDEMKKAINESI